MRMKYYLAYCRKGLHAFSLGFVVILGLMCVSVSGGQTASADTTAMDLELQKDIAHLRDISTARDLRAFEAAADSLLKKWADRDDMRRSDFLHSTASLLQSADFGNQEQQTALLNQYVVAGLERGGIAPLDTEMRLLMMLPLASSSRPQDWPESRTRITHLWLTAWQRMDQELAKPFDAQDLPEENVRPPAETGLPAGVSPQDIHDPVLRRRYEEALAQNNAKAQQLRLRHSLEKLRTAFKKAAGVYLSDAYSVPPANVDELIRNLDAYVSDRDARTEIIEKVRK